MAVTTTSGNGFALYNGVKLPNIDSVWTDKETYPYAYAAPVPDVVVSYYYVYVSTIPIVNNDGSIIFEGDGAFRLYHVLCSSPALDNVASAEGATAQDIADAVGVELDVLTFLYEIEVEGSHSLTQVIGWASADIINSADQSVYLAASDPIPLDGMTVIEWDGDTTGLEDFSDMGFQYVYKISDTYHDLAEGGDAVLVLRNSDGELGVFPSEFCANIYNSETDGDNKWWSLRLSSIYYVTSFNVPSVATVGTGFLNIDGGYCTTLFAYTPAATDEPEEPKETNDTYSLQIGIAIGLGLVGWPDIGGGA